MRPCRSLLTAATLVSSLLSSVAAQATQFTGLNPESVPLTIRESWCTSEKGTCLQLCIYSSSSTNSTGNNCNPQTLSYLCQCVDGTQPAIAQYQDSLSCLATDYLLGNCLNNATTTAATNACHISYYCQGLNPKNIPGSDNSSSSSSSSTPQSSTTPATSISLSSQAPTAVISGIPTSSTSSIPSTSDPDNDSHRPKISWVAAPIIIVILVLCAVLVALWLLRRRRRNNSNTKDLKPHTRLLRSHPNVNDSTEMLWHKAELDGKEKPAFSSRRAELDGHGREPPAEMEGSPVPYFELEGSTPLYEKRASARSSILPLRLSLLPKRVSAIFSEPQQMDENNSGTKTTGTDTTTTTAAQDPKLGIRRSTTAETIPTPSTANLLSPMSPSSWDAIAGDSRPVSPVTPVAFPSSSLTSPSSHIHRT